MKTLIPHPNNCKHFQDSEIEITNCGNCKLPADWLSTESFKMRAKERAAREAIAALNSALMEFDFWPDDRQTLKNAVAALQRYL